MKKLDLVGQDEFDVLQDDYYIPKQMIEREHNKFKKQRDIMFITMCTTIAVSFGLCFYALQTSRESKTIKTVAFATDGKGGLLALKNISDPHEIDPQKYMRSQMQSYVIALYSIPYSKEMRQENANRVIASTQQNYYQNVEKHIFQTNYTDDAQITDVKVTSLAEVNKNVWQVNWDKKVDGNVIGKYKTWITYRIEALDDVEIASYNPSGMVVTNVETQEDIK